MARTTRKPKHTPTQEELANDPSLRWNHYRGLELLWSDSHGAELRFLRYDGGLVVLANLAGGELPERHDPLTIRRLMRERTR